MIESSFVNIGEGRAKDALDLLCGDPSCSSKNLRCENHIVPFHGEDAYSLPFFSFSPVQAASTTPRGCENPRARQGTLMF